MFGRLDEDEEFTREYMIVSNYTHEDPIVFNIDCTPADAKEIIRGEIESYKEVGFAVYELVEYVTVDEYNKAMFTEDWHFREAEEDNGDI